jgi:hypothetical protein
VRPSPAAVPSRCARTTARAAGRDPMPPLPAPRPPR